MMPEILEDARGRIVGVIVALALGSYEASVRVKNPRGLARKSLILQKSFGQLEEARNWIRINTLMGGAEAV